MKPAILLFILFIIVFDHAMRAKDYYVPDLHCCDITDQILDLKISTAKKNIQEQLESNPDNYYLYYLDQFADFVLLLIAANEDRYHQLDENFDRYREIMDRKDTGSPYYLFVLSSMQLQLSLAKLKFGNNLAGARLGFKAFRNMERNTEKFPDFYGNKKLRGLFNVMLDNVPPFLRTVASIFGVKAGKESTYDLLTDYKADIHDKPGLSTEASIYIALSLLLDQKTDEAYRYISSLEEDYFKIFLIKYFYGNLAYHNGDNEIARQAFSELDIQNLEVRFYPYYFIYGKILMNCLSPNAKFYLETFIDETNGIDYLKQAHLYLGYYQLIAGDRLQYEIEMLNVRKEGNDKTERDREALLDMKRGYTPDTTLLKTSFLVKGSYYSEADSMLNTFPERNNVFLPYHLESFLLKGEIEEGLGKIDLAIESYTYVFENGSDEHFDFATIATLHLGRIYETREDFDEALHFYQTAKDLYRSDYYESYEALAKKGVERMENQQFTNE
jgi:hypothetical protein